MTQHTTQTGMRVFVSIAMLAVIFAATAVPAMAESSPSGDGAVDYTMYDKNGDGAIDAEERITLDIDIESCRVTFDESAYADTYTTDNTVVLNDEFQEMALSPVNRVYTGKSPVNAKIEAKPVENTADKVTTAVGAQGSGEDVATTHDSEPEPTETTESTKESGSPMALVIFGVLAVAAIISKYHKAK
ncbi:MAG: hypothetical protein U9N46_14520 [Euryarchaeota archaeon]|nr:MAG: hypothetical protein C5S48_07035 [ANME-2 cluster archaeon]MEA1866375.1 hypothetical protein [Euryarchaeota archaeon]